jgi:hypothetical protein
MNLCISNGMNGDWGGRGLITPSYPILIYQLYRLISWEKIEMNEKSEPDLVKPRNNRGIYSLIIGITSILFTFGLLFLWGNYGWEKGGEAGRLILLGMPLNEVYLLFGIYLGLQGLKYTKRVFSISGLVISIIGMIICSLSLLFSLYTFLYSTII